MTPALGLGEARNLVPGIQATLGTKSSKIWFQLSLGPYWEENRTKQPQGTQGSG